MAVMLPWERASRRWGRLKWGAGRLGVRWQGACVLRLVSTGMRHWLKGGDSEGGASLMQVLLLPAVELPLEAGGASQQMLAAQMRVVCGLGWKRQWEER